MSSERAKELIELITNAAFPHDPKPTNLKQAPDLRQWNAIKDKTGGDPDTHDGCCTACQGAGATLDGPCWDCLGTGHSHA